VTTDWSQTRNAAWDPDGSATRSANLMRDLNSPFSASFNYIAASAGSLTFGSINLYGLTC
jgi:hypothetical protein